MPATVPRVEDEGDDEPLTTAECYPPALATWPGWRLFPCPFFHV